LFHEESQTLIQRASRNNLCQKKANKLEKINESLTRDDLDLKPYKQPDMNEIETNDYPKRLDFCVKKAQK